MGLAVMDGVRQGGLRKTASADDWIAHGYSARRRSTMFVIGDVLIKNQNAYREVYLARKRYERDRAISNGLTVCAAAKIPAKRKDEFMSDGHIHRRAQRYMEKRLLRDLWRAWRTAKTETSPAPAPGGVPPSASSSAQAEPQAKSSAPTMAPTPAALPSAQAERSAKLQVTTDVVSPSASTRQTRDREKPIARSSGKRPAAPLMHAPDASHPAKAGRRRATQRANTESITPAAS